MKENKNSTSKNESIYLQISNTYHLFKTIFIVYLK